MGSSEARAAEYNIASHLINNFGTEYKNNSRSTFDHAQKIVSGVSDATWDSTIAVNVGSLKPSSFAVANDAEVERYITAVKEGKLTEEQVTRLGSIVEQALSTETIRGSMKDSQVQRFEKLLGIITDPKFAKYAPTPSSDSNPSEDAGASHGPGGVGPSNSPMAGLTGSNGGRSGGHPGGGLGGGGHP